MEIDFEHLHHAYLLVGNPPLAEKALLSAFEDAGTKLIGSPDYFVSKGALFGIDDARALSERAIQKAFTGRKVFFIAPERITPEAQNALLKTFEEPIEHTHFFLALREESLVLPTLLSRMQVVHVQHSVLNKEAEKFLKLSIKERLSFVKKFIDKEQNLSNFLDELLLELKALGNREALERVYKMRLVSDDRGVLPRLVLEHLAVVL